MRANPFIVSHKNRRYTAFQLPLLAFVLAAVIVIGEKAQAAFDSVLGIDPATQLSDELYATVPSLRLLAADFLPDGRALALTQLGAVHLVPVGGGASTLLFALTDIDNSFERGALDIKTDPGFAQNRFFYITYTAPRGTNKVVVRLSRFKLESTGVATLASQKILWENPGPVATGEAHLGGFLLIGPDNKFYISIGENLTSGNSQNLSTIFGSIVRLNMDGTIPADNPFVGQAGALGEIWAYGVRNPFRGSFDPDTGDLIVGDVGGNNAATAREEINVIKRGANYGWPLCEGRSGCPSGVTLPVVDYGHDVNAGCCANRAIMGGFMNRNTTVPTANNIYLFADFSGSTLEWVRFGERYSIIGRGQLTIPGTPRALRPIWMEVNPFDRQIYYITFNYQGIGQLRRLRYTGGTQNRPPVSVRATVSKESVDVGQSVIFTGSATDPDNDALQYLWNFGDGSNGTGATVNKTWNSSGSYTVSLRVSDGVASTPAVPISISVGSRPVATIDSPVSDIPFTAGQTLRFTGSAFSAAGVQLPGSALSWEVRLFHGNHEHPEISGVTGGSFQFTVPTSGHDFQGDTGYAVYLSATGPNGLTTTVTRRVSPKKIQVTFRANQPVNNPVTLDDLVHPVPFTLDTVSAFKHRVAMDDTLCVGKNLWKFQAWSNGAAKDHVLTVPSANLTLTATFIDSGPSGQCGAAATPPSAGTPTTPGNFLAKRYSKTAGEIFWDASTDNGRVVAYRVLKDGQQIAQRDARSYFDTSLIAGNAYRFEVIAVDNENNLSAPALVTMPSFGTSTPAPTPQPPASSSLPAVSNLKSSVYSKSAAELFWQRVAVTGQSIRYEVYRDGKLVKTTDGSSYFDNSLIAGVRHTFEIVTLSSDGRRSSPASIQVSTGLSSPSSPSTPSVGPDKPADLARSVYSRTAAEIFWQPPIRTIGALRYEVTRNGRVVATIDGRSYFDSTLVAGTRYTFGVSTLDSLQRRSDPYTIEVETRP